jgi:hypothetical protein
VKARTVASRKTMRPVPLTRLQKRLLGELREIAALTRLNYADIRGYPRREWTHRLKFMKNQLIRSQVIIDYALVDELLGSEICYYFFGRKSDFIRLWKTKRFRAFNYYVVEVLTLTEKLRLVKEIRKVPKAVAKNIEGLNALRNGLAHTLFPENLRSSKPIYKGRDIFTVQGLAFFIGEMGKVSDFFLHHNLWASVDGGVLEESGGNPGEPPQEAPQE